MRPERTVQASIFDLFAQHEIGCELKKASQWLDEHPALIGLVAADLRRDGVQETGRHGLPAESVLRCALLKQHRQLSAGIEAGISCLKRAYGLARCTWRGLDRFRAYVWSSVVAYNTALFV